MQVFFQLEISQNMLLLVTECSHLLPFIWQFFVFVKNTATFHHYLLQKLQNMAAIYWLVFQLMIIILTDGTILQYQGRIALPNSTDYSPALFLILKYPTLLAHMANINIFLLLIQFSNAYQ